MQLATVTVLALTLICVHGVHALTNVTADAFVPSKEAPEIVVVGATATLSESLEPGVYWRSAYGTRIFTAGSGIIRWHVRVTRPADNVVNAWDYAVGVAANDARPDFMFWDNNLGIAYFQQSGHTTAFGERTNLQPYSDGDIIQIDLDLDAATISFSKNGVSQGIAHSGFNTAGTWRVAVGFSSKDYAATLVDADGNDATEPPAQSTSSSGTSGDGTDADSGDGGGDGGGGNGGNGDAVSIGGAAATTESTGIDAGAIAGIVIGAVVIACIVVIGYRKFAGRNSSRDSHRASGNKVSPQATPGASELEAARAGDDTTPRGTG
mmetsp:Transcript_17829/g.51853  ORF Transcript_17829/g.51853 Transcript_17829/m.51853 type:complete len:322 (-) Transcript_17829:306-1271(-)